MNLHSCILYTKFEANLRWLTKKLSLSRAISRRVSIVNFKLQATDHLGEKYKRFGKDPSSLAQLLPSLSCHSLCLSGGSVAPAFFTTLCANESETHRSAGQSPSSAQDMGGRRGGKKSKMAARSKHSIKDATIGSKSRGTAETLAAVDGSLF